MLLIERNILLFCILPLTKIKINSILQISNKKQKKGVGGWEKIKRDKIMGEAKTGAWKQILYFDKKIKVDLYSEVWLDTAIITEHIQTRPAIITDVIRQR